MSVDKYMKGYPDPKQWVVVRCRRDRARVTIRHSDGSAASAWIARLRSSHPALQDRSPSDLLDEVRRTEGIDLGELAGREARRIAALLGSQGFDVVVTDASCVDHLATVDGHAVLIEDSAEGERFCMHLIHGGATVQEVEG